MALESLQKAVERARSDGPVERESSVDRRKALVGPLTLDDIRYTQTREVEFDGKAAQARRLVAHVEGSRAAQRFGSLAMQVLLKMRKHRFVSLGVFAPSGGTGASLVAANLAVAMAREPNQTVLAVDLNLREPRLAEYFGVSPEFGLVDHLVNNVPVPQMLVNPGIRRLVLLPGRNQVDGADELLASRRMAELMKELKERYESRVVLYDVPPLLGRADALPLVERIDCGLLVVQEGRTTKRELEDAGRTLSGVPLVGSVVSQGRPSIRPR